MAKSNAKKKAKSSPPAAKRPGAKANKTVKSEASYYLVTQALAVEVSNAKPPAGATAIEFATFDDARSAAIECLVEAIEAAESRLLALKRAKTLAQCRKAAAR